MSTKNKNITPAESTRNLRPRKPVEKGKPSTSGTLPTPPLNASKKGPVNSSRNNVTPTIELSISGTSDTSGTDTPPVDRTTNLSERNIDCTRLDPKADNGVHGPFDTKHGITGTDAEVTVPSKVVIPLGNSFSPKCSSLAGSHSQLIMAPPTNDVDFLGIADALEQFYQNQSVTEWKKVQSGALAIRTLVQSMANLVCNQIASTNATNGQQLNQPSTSKASFANVAAHNLTNNHVNATKRQQNEPIRRTIVVRDNTKKATKPMKEAVAIKITAESNPKATITELEKMSSRVPDIEPIKTVVTQRGTVVLFTKTTDEAIKIKESLQDSSMKVSVEGKSMPRAKIMRIPSHIDDEVVTESLGPEAIILSTQSAKDHPTRDLIVALPGNKYQELVEKRSVRLSRFVCCEVRAHNDVPQCGVCLQLGHGSQSCTEETKEKGIRCSHCAEHGHIHKNCPNKEERQVPVCGNCLDKNLGNHAHSAFSNRCPLKKQYAKRRARATDWGNGTNDQH